jgi:hypothetical protein
MRKRGEPVAKLLSLKEVVSFFFGDVATIKLYSEVKDFSFMADVEVV